MRIRHLLAATSFAVLTMAVPMAAHAQEAVKPSLTLKAAKAQFRPVSFASTLPAPSGTLVLPLASEADLARRASALSEAERTAIARALASAEFDYTSGTLSLRGIGGWD
ncbi:MAG: leucyl aminopeptidase, partial [Blastomonas sp.]|nr:leucyl aminopeptidase [Blastomonas sp.]